MDLRTRIRKASNRNRNDQGSAAAAGDALPPTRSRRMEQPVRKGRKGRNDKMPTVPHSRRETTRSARISNGRVSVRARSSAALSASGARMDNTRRDTSDAASHNGPRASTMNSGANKSRRDDNVPGRTNFRQPIRLARIGPGRGQEGRKRRNRRGDGAEAIPNSARNRVRGDGAGDARSPASNQEKTGGAGPMPSRVNGGRSAGHVVTMKRPNASRPLGRGTSVGGSRAEPCARRSIPPAAVGPT